MNIRYMDVFIGYFNNLGIFNNNYIIINMITIGLSGLLLTF